MPHRRPALGQLAFAFLAEWLPLPVAPPPRPPPPSPLPGGWWRRRLGAPRKPQERSLGRDVRFHDPARGRLRVACRPFQRAGSLGVKIQKSSRYQT
jgi:hypothetical protein